MSVSFIIQETEFNDACWMYSNRVENHNEYSLMISANLTQNKLLSCQKQMLIRIQQKLNGDCLLVLFRIDNFII